MKKDQETSTDKKSTDQKSDANNNNDTVEKPNTTTVTSSTDKKQVEPRYVDEQERKLFIGYPANSSMNDVTFTEFFSKFGTVERVIIKRDQMTQKPRGFGFLTMSTVEEVQKVLQAGPIEIKGKQVECKLAVSRPITKKIFVGGIDTNTTSEQISDYFSKFGKVEDLELPYDRVRKKRREFCFVIFETEEQANLASNEPKQTINGKECDVKKATPQPVAQQQKRLNLQQSINSTQSNQYANLNHSRNARNFFASPNSLKSNGSFEPYNQRNYRKSIYSRNYQNSVDGDKGLDYEIDMRAAKPPNGRQRQWINNQNGIAGVPVGNHAKVFNRSYTGYYNKDADANQKVYNKERRDRRSRGGPMSYKHDREDSVNNYAFAKQQTNPNYAQNYDQMAPQNNYYGYQYQCDMYQVPGQNYQSVPQNAQTYITPNFDYYQQYYSQYYQNPQGTIQQQPPQYATNQCYTNYQAANSVDANTTIQQQPTPTGPVDTYQSLDEQYYAEQQKYDNDLLNNNPNYDKFGAPESNYVAQPVNTNLLNVQQYQSSIQQC